MYYIINQSDQVVAIDPQLLSELGMESGDDFYKKMALKEIVFMPKDGSVEINIDGEVRQYTATVSPMEGLLGDIRLVDIKERIETAASTEHEEMISFDDIDLFDTKEEAVSSEEPSVPPTQEEDELFELILPSDADNAISEIGTAQEKVEPFLKDETASNESGASLSSGVVPEDNSTPIYIDVARISDKIGISTDDYTLFLNEYIDTALSYEKALQSDNEAEKEEALTALIHLSNVLHLPFVGDILEQIKHASLPERDALIGSFFETLGRLTTAHFEDEKRTTQTVMEEPSEEVTSTIEEKRAPIDLSGVQPIHFDFQLEEAAKDLSLPVELIEEFVNDFITQAHEETEKMLAAYEKGDLETVQKIGHLLKGTSSNLRINPLSDTLYEIQFNEDIDRVPELVKNYWAHFLSLEKQIELISKKVKGNRQ